MSLAEMHVLFGIPLLVLAMAILAHMIRRIVRERRLRRRLVPVAARVTQQGGGFTRRILSTSWDNGVRTDTTIDDYVGRWEYVVAGRRYEGKVVLEQPVFRKDQMPPAVVQVYYDATDPAISRMTLCDDKVNIRAIGIFAAFVALVGAILVATALLTADQGDGHPASRPTLQGPPGSAPM